MMTILPEKLYSAAAAAELDRIASAEFNIPAYTLMRRAGQSALDCLLDCFPEAKNILVLCGAGNNAGDGYVLARQAQAHGLQVHLVTLVDIEQLKGIAQQACQHWLEVGRVYTWSDDYLEQADVVVDALLGTGLKRAVSPDWCELINTVNASEIPVLSLDLPSGLLADTGAIAGCAVRADVTMSFIALKQGQFTGQGLEYCGEIFFDDLMLPESAYSSVEQGARLLDQLSCDWPERALSAHKGDFGHVLVVGGNHGMAGAVLLAARAALRSGAGKVSVITRSEHVNAIVSAGPEIMVHASDNGDIDEHLISAITHIAIGPGLGQDAWAQRLLMQALRAAKPLVIDADALTLMQQKQLPFPDQCVITPHPGEAARLLSLTSADIQNDRFAAIRRLQQSTGALVLLKGSGTLIADADDCYVCPFGSSAMASAGMGDVLTGILVALLAQGLTPVHAATTAVCQHALAADRLVEAGQRVVLAGDVIEALSYA
jgi:NAD(P)H-hydrate epimerase